MKNPIIKLFGSLKERFSLMYYNSIWPGSYSFKNEIKLFVQWFKMQTDSILNKIEETEKKLSSSKYSPCNT